MLFNKKLVTIAVLASSMVAGSALAAGEVGKKALKYVSKLNYVRLLVM